MPKVSIHPFSSEIVASVWVCQADDGIGIWLSPPSQNPVSTFIGSSNLSTRSLQLDTELSLLIVTSSPSLRKALGQEIKALDEFAGDVGETTWREESRKVSWLAWLLVALGVEGML